MTHPTISVLVASRGRPGLAKRMADSIRRTESRRAEILFYIDKDDKTAATYDVDADITIGTRCSAAERINRLAKIATGDVLILCGDDVVFETPQWDERIFESMPPDNIACFSFNHCRGGVGHPHPAITKMWHQIIGYVAHDAFHHFCIDTWIIDVAQRVGRLVYLDNVKLAHKKVVDETYAWVRRNSPQDDTKIFHSLENIRVEHANKLKKYIEYYRVSAGES